MKNESGRSMIEMLGVLAIVGILSVTAISGFSKAMEKHKINKCKEELNEISTNIITMYRNAKNYSDLDIGIARDIGAIPDHMITQGRVTHALGGSVSIVPVDYNGVRNGAFAITFDNLPRKVAIELGMDGNNITNTNLMYIQVGNTN